MFQKLTAVSFTQSTKDRDRAMSVGEWNQLHEFLSTVEQYDGLIGVDFGEYLYFDCRLMGTSSERVHIRIEQYAQGRDRYDDGSPTTTAYWWGRMMGAFLPTDVFHRFLRWQSQRRMALILDAQKQHPHLYGKWSARPLTYGEWHVSMEPQRPLYDNGNPQRFQYWSVSKADTARLHAELDASEAARRAAYAVTN
jgi:hypothetical protein